MPAGLYARWRKFFAVEPWGFRWDWLKTGTVAAAIYNTAFGRKKGEKPVQPEAFVPTAKAAKKPRTWQDEKALMMGWAGAGPPAAITPPNPPPTPSE